MASASAGVPRAPNPEPDALEQTMRDDLKPGNIFPDFTLADQTGAEQSLSGVMNGWPLVLTFNRGNY